LAPFCSNDNNYQLLKTSGVTAIGSATDTSTNTATDSETATATDSKTATATAT
jgi:hypothetical protein